MTDPHEQAARAEFEDAKRSIDTVDRSAGAEPASDRATADEATDGDAVRREETT